MIYLTQQRLLFFLFQMILIRYESGALDIPSTSLIQLAKFYKTSIDYLLGLTNNKRPRRTVSRHSYRRKSGCIYYQ
ncbi:hypothetical protein [Desulfosporosinus meridiei]|uniref:hypothetical protein n=1 Tax=Desulfosporosinus meridiei TaxID=79209 RepID=UPI0009FDC16F|nr:hypothetical protein [Desulfosporosinus meridiei]